MIYMEQFWVNFTKYSLKKVFMQSKWDYPILLVDHL